MLLIRLDWSQTELSLPAGARLLDAIDELVDPPVVFSCRDAHCGTCLVDLRDGAELFVAPNDGERRMLTTLVAAHTSRLACRLRAGSRPGEVVLAKPPGIPARG